MTLILSAIARSAALLLAVAAAAPAMPPELTLPKTISSSKQFVVYSRDSKQRGAAAGFAEEVKGSWVEVVGRPDNWKFPILIVLGEEASKGRQAPFNVTAILGDGGIGRVQVDVADPATIGSPEMAVALFDALIMESTLRSPKASFSIAQIRKPPHWISQALTQKFLAKRSPPPAQIIEGLMQGSRTPSVASVLRQNRLPSSLMEQTVFRVLAYGLLNTLLGAQGGDATLRAFFASSALADFDHSTRGIVEAFPALGSEDGLERLWTLSLARMSLPARSNLLSSRDTSSELAKILDVQIDTSKKRGEAETLRGMSALPHLASSEGGQRAMMGIATRLMALELRAHPLWLPFIRSLREICLQLARRPKSNVSKRLDSLDADLKRLETTENLIEDHMNWVEANLLGGPDPAFQEMFRMQESFIDAPPREDAVTLSIDAAERRFQTR